MALRPALARGLPLSGAVIYFSTLILRVMYLCRNGTWVRMEIEAVYESLPDVLYASMVKASTLPLLDPPASGQSDPVSVPEL